MKMCKSCPFNYCSEQSEMAQNYGCLPGPKEVLDLKDSTNENWACHTHNKRICVGLSENRDTTTGPLHLQPGTNSKFISWKEEDLKPILKPNPTYEKIQR